MSRSLTTIKTNYAREEALKIINKVFPNVSHYELYDFGILCMLQRAKSMADLDKDIVEAIKAISGGSNRWN